MNSKKPLLCSLLLCILALSSGSITAEIYYKWVDEQGTVHYGEQPSTEYESTPIKASDTYATETEETNGHEISKEELAKREEAKKYCEIANENLDVLNSGDKIEQRDQYGNLRALTPEELISQKELAQAAVKKYCTS